MSQECPCMGCRLERERAKELGEEKTPVQRYPKLLPPPPPRPRPQLEEAVAAMRGELKAVLGDVRALRADTGEFRRELGALRRACGFEPPLATDPSKPRLNWQVRQFVVGAAGAGAMALWELLSTQVHAWLQ